MVLIRECGLADWLESWVEIEADTLKPRIAENGGVKEGDKRMEEEREEHR